MGRVDASDLYRAALVNAVGAIEAYTRGVILDRAVEIVLGRRLGGLPDKRVGLSFSAVGAILGESAPADREIAARSHLAARLSLETFQQPDDIGRGLALVGVGRVWKTAFGSEAEKKTQALSLVVRRRNHIVHTCDADPSSPGGVQPISDGDARTAVETIEEICRGIDKLW